MHACMHTYIHTYIHTHTYIHSYSHIEIARERLRYYFTETAYPFFDSSKGEGECLVKILLDLLKYDDDQLRLSSVLLLFDIYQVQ